MIRCFFSSWNSLPSWTQPTQEPSNQLILCWGRNSSYVLIFGRSNIPNVLFALVWEFEFEGLLQLQMPKQMLKWCASEFFPQNSTRSMTMNATTIKVNGKFQTLALGLSLGDGTSAQIKSNQHGAWIVFGATRIIDWREEWRQLFLVSKWGNLTNEMLRKWILQYWSWNCSKTHKLMPQTTSIPALRPDSIGQGKKPGPPRSCDDSGECRILAVQMCQQEQVVRFGVRSFQQDAATAADLDCAFAPP